MLASWSHEGVVFLDLLSSSHSITSSLFPYLGSTDAPCSRLGDPVSPSQKWRPHSQGSRTLPYRDPEQFLIIHLLYKIHAQNWAGIRVSLAVQNHGPYAAQNHTNMSVTAYCIGTIEQLTIFSKISCTYSSSLVLSLMYVVSIIFTNSRRYSNKNRHHWSNPPLTSTFTVSDVKTETFKKKLPKKG